MVQNANDRRCKGVAKQPACDQDMNCILPLIVAVQYPSKFWYLEEEMLGILNNPGDILCRLLIQTAVLWVLF